MKTIVTNVYTFEELNEEAQKRAIENCRSSIAQFLCQCNDDDFRGTLDKIEDVFSIKVRDLEGRPYWRMTSSRWADVEDEEGGRMLCRYLNDVADALDNRRRYYKGLEKLRIARTIHDPYCYCLTGVYSDSVVDNALNNMYDAVRRGDSIHDFIGELLSDFATDWEKNNESTYDDDTIREEIIANEYEFEANGREWR